MACCQQNACGLPSIPRFAFPTMFEILSWSAAGQSNIPESQQCSPSIHQLKSIDKNEEAKIIDHALSKSECYSQNKRPSKSTNTKYQLYYYKQDPIRRSQSQIHCPTADPIICQARKVENKKKLDPNNPGDLKQIEARKKRIKEFEYVTRDLPNSAFTTYFGKPTFQAYGRGNSNPSLLTHNVMPHRGTNYPKKMQSYYSALLQGKRHSTSTYVPRKPVEEMPNQYIQKPQIVIHLPLQTPDLINNVRFTSQKVDRKKDSSIPTHKISPMTQKMSKKKIKPQKNKKQSPVSKKTIDLDDGLKYMNTRENLLKIIENKKINTTKLPYKVTECYPFEWQNQQKARQLTQIWSRVVVAGKPSAKGDPVSTLLSNENLL